MSSVSTSARSSRIASSLSSRPEDSRFASAIFDSSSADTLSLSSRILSASARPASTSARSFASASCSAAISTRSASSFSVSAFIFSDATLRSSSFRAPISFPSLNFLLFSASRFFLFSSRAAIDFCNSDSLEASHSIDASFARI